MRTCGNVRVGFSAFLDNMRKNGPFCACFAGGGAAIGLFFLPQQWSEKRPKIGDRGAAAAPPAGVAAGQKKTRPRRGAGLPNFTRSDGPTSCLSFSA